MEKEEFIINSVDPFRKASLLLYGLSSDDQKWILKNLPKDQSEKVYALLDELEKIGLRADDSVVKDLLNHIDLAEEDGRLGSSIEYVGMVKKIDVLSVRDIKNLLSGEPLEIIAMVLSIKNWSWSAKYLSSIEHSDRDEIRTLLKNYVGAINEQVKHAIVAYLSLHSSNILEQ